MSRELVLIALATIGLSFSTARAGEPIYDKQAGHPWDRAREIFYAHRFSTGEVYEHPHAFAPPWREFVPFVHEADFYAQVIARLEAVEKLPPAQMEDQPAMRRLIFLGDLWAIFDGLHQALVNVPRDKEATAKATLRREELLRRVAGLMRRLELTEDEVRELPNAFAIAADKSLLPKSFDPASPREPFLPVELLDKDGPWIAYSQQKEPNGGTAHASHVHNRSLFTLHLRTSDGGEKFLRDWTASEGKMLIPQQTTLALLRRALVPTRSGKVMLSPLVESLQLIAVTPEKDEHFKFTLDRRELLSGGLGLKPLSKDDPVDTSSFESIILPDRLALAPSKTEPPSESLIALRYKTLKEIPSSLNNCIRCHSYRNQLFGSSGPVKAAYVQSDLDALAATLVKKKEAASEWKEYLRLRAESAK